MDYIISLTNKCNLRCKYCYERHLNTEYGHISDETAEDIIKFINGRKDVNFVYLFGGEPLLYKELIKKFVSSISAKLFIITTNGMLLDEDFIKWCAVSRNIRINMSHDGMDCSDRGIDVNELNKKLKILLKYQPDTLLQLVYTEKTLPKLSENIKYFKSLGVKKVSAVMDSFTNPADLDHFGDLLKDEWEKAANISGMYILELSDRTKIINGKKNPKCEVCKKKMFINWDGKIYPCVQFQNVAEFQCGDVVRGMENTKTILDHPDYSSLSKLCEGCEIAEYCRNSCACKKMASTGTLRSISEASCLEEQVLILTALNIMKNKMDNNYGDVPIVT